MSDSPAIPFSYQTEGGALQIDAPTYVQRKADEDLYQGLKASKLCYVLNARQMGKSSLKVRTIQRLQKEGIACAAVDLQGIGTSATEEQWYVGIISRIARPLQLHRQFNVNSWWIQHQLLSCVQRFTLFLETVLLPAIPQPIVIFIDEVDLTLSLPFSGDDFFGALRECYNRRADEPNYRRLTFALLGVATPSELIRKKQTAPFNIGQPIDLTGFQPREAQPLLPGLAAKASNPQVLLDTVLDWTGGQPFLTQKVCQLILTADSTPIEGHETEWVAQIVRNKIIENWEAQDTPQHLKTIRDRLLHSEERTGRLLGLYQQLLQEEVAVDDSPEQMEIRLSGLVVQREGRLQVYNQIYKAVFNLDWVNDILAGLRPYAESLTSWLASDCQDESRLLRGQALQDAQTWAAGKKLTDQDYEYLSASQELDKRAVQAALDAEREAKKILSRANRKAKRQIQSSLIILAIALIAAFGLGLMAVQSKGIAQQNIAAANSAKVMANSAQKRLIKIQKDVERVQRERLKAKQEALKLDRQVQAVSSLLLDATQKLHQSQLDKNQAKQELSETEREIQQAIFRLKQSAEQLNRKEEELQDLWLFNLIGNVVSSVLPPYMKKSGQVQMSQEELFKESINSLTRAIERNPNNVSNLYYKRGILYFTVFFTELSKMNERAGFGDIESSIKDFSMAVEINKNNVAILFTRSLAYISKAVYTYAYGKDKQGLEQVTDLHTFMNFLPSFDSILIDKALADHNSILEIQPNNFVALLFRAVIYRSRKDYSQALLNYNHAIDTSSGDILSSLLINFDVDISAVGYILRSETYQAQGKIEQARADLSQASKVDSLGAWKELINSLKK